MSQHLAPPLELFKSMDRLRKAWQDITPAPDISKSLYSVLMVISHAHLACVHGVEVKVVDDCVSLTDLSLMLRQSLPVVSQRTRTLENLGYVYRVANPADRRVSRIGLTDSGKALVERAHVSLNSKLSGALHCYGDENVAALITMLDRLSGVLEDAEINFNYDKENTI